MFVWRHRAWARRVPRRRRSPPLTPPPPPEPLTPYAALQRHGSKSMYAAAAAPSDTRRRVPASQISSFFSSLSADSSVVTNGAGGGGGERLRIAKAIARGTGLSRRVAERLIAEQQVTLNGSVVLNPATHITLPDNDNNNDASADADAQQQQQQQQQQPQEQQHDVIWVQGHGRVDLRRVSKRSGARGHKTRLWILHKLRRELVTEHDPEGRPTVFQRVESMMGRDAFRHLGIKSVGRLDFMSEGLLLLTNDGVLKRYLELPATGMEREYLVEVRGKLNKAWLNYLGRGATVDHVKYRPIGVDVLRSDGAKRHVMTVRLREGKTREVRRVMEAGGMSVTKLQRTAFGPYTLGGVPRGSLQEIRPRRECLKGAGVLLDEKKKKKSHNEKNKKTTLQGGVH